MAPKFVIDTNVIVSALSSKSVFHWLIRLILDEKIDLFVTDEILFEYEEVLKSHEFTSSFLQNCLCNLNQI